MSTHATAATCFGKVPSRGDFVKGSGQHQLINVLDRWVSAAMEQLSENPRWKQVYDEAVPVDFIFTGARSRISVVGHLRPSADASGRRYPFMTATTIERSDALVFRCAPAGLAATLGVLAKCAEAGSSGGDLPEIFAQLEAVRGGEEFEQSLVSDSLGNFVRRTTIAALARMLETSPDAVRRIILALGILMQAVQGQAQASIEKGLVLPLPADEQNRNLTAALWLYLATAFLRHTGIELDLLIVRHARQPRLILGFNGSAPTMLVAAISPEMTNGSTILLDDPEWVETQAALTNDYGVAKLSTYLNQPNTPLEQVVTTFREVFLGE